MNKLFKKTWKRGAAMVLALAMMLTLVPCYSASAAEAEVAQATVIADDSGNSLGEKVDYTGYIRRRIYLPKEYQVTVGDVITLKVDTDDTAGIQVQPACGSNRSDNFIIATDLSKNNSTLVYTVGEDWMNAIGNTGTVYFRFKSENSDASYLSATVTVTRNVIEYAQAVDVPVTLIAESGYETKMEFDDEFASDDIACLKLITAGDKARGGLVFPEDFRVAVGGKLVINYVSELETTGAFTYGSGGKDTFQSKSFSKGEGTLEIPIDASWVEWFAGNDDYANYSTRIRLLFDAGTYEQGNHLSIKSVKYVAPLYTIAPTSMLLDDGTTSIATITMDPSNGKVKAGNKVTVNATDMLNNTFLGWYSPESISNNAIVGEPLSTSFNYTFEVASDKELVAVYQAKQDATAVISITGDGYTVTVDGNAATVEAGKCTAPIGSKVVVTATNDKFINWCNGNNKIVTSNKEYSFTLLEDETLNMSVKGTDDSVKVNFVSLFGQIVSTGTYKSYAEIVVPAGPSRMGYNFTEWNMNETDFTAKVNDVYEVLPSYEHNGTKHTVTVLLNGESNNTITVDSGEGVTVDAPESEGVFQYWTDASGNILGYSKSYYMQINKDFTLNAVYAENEVSAKPVIAMTNVFKTANPNKISFSVTRDIPEGYKLVEHGIIVNREGTADAANDKFVIGADNVTRFKASSESKYGVYTLNVKVINDTTNVVARGYMILEDTNLGRQEIYYTDVATCMFSE